MTCSPQTRRTGRAQHHRRVPALRCSTRPGTPAACGGPCGSRHRAGPHRPPPGAVPRRRRHAAPTCACRPARQRRAAAVTIRTSIDGEVGRRVAARRRGGPERDRVEHRHRPIRRCGGRGRSAISRSPTSPSRSSIDGAIERPTRAACAPGSARSRWDNWVCSVNGERLFLKGANLPPGTELPADATSERMRGDLQAAVDLGLDALRIHGHIADRELYDAADELGLLLLQDFPLQWGYARSVRARGGRAGACGGRLARTPSVDRDVVRARRSRRRPTPTADRPAGAVRCARSPTASSRAGIAACSTVG